MLLTLCLSAEGHFLLFLRLSVSEHQQSVRLDLQLGGEVEEQVQRYRAAEVRRLYRAEMLPADSHTLGKLLLRQPLVLSVVRNVVPQLYTGAFELE